MSQDLRLQVILQTIDKSSAILKKIDGSSSAAAQSLRDTRKRLKELDAQQKTIGRFRELRTGLEDTSAKLNAAKDRVRQLAKELNASGPPTQKMIGQFKQAKVAAAVLGQQFQDQQVNVQKLRDKLSAAGISAAKLSEHERALRSEFKATSLSIQEQNTKLQQLAEKQAKLNRLRTAHAKEMMHVGMVAGAGYAMQTVGSSAVRRAMVPVNDFGAHENAMLGIARQVPGARGADGKLTDVYRKIEEQVRVLSTQVPQTTVEIAEMFTAAARMEVPVDQLMEFTRTASMMATAFDAVPDEITEAMGKVAKNFKMPITQITGLADAINYLDDNAISKGADIIEFLNRTSGTASTVAMTAKDAAALGSTLLTLGERTETAGTATNAILTKFAAATKGTKKFRSALDEIGISAESLERGMSTNATATLLQVIEAIRALPKDKQLGVMAELVGLEHADTLAKLADKAEELRRQLALANGPDGEGSMSREAQARNETWLAQKIMLRNRVFNLSSAIGDTLKPALISLLKVVNPMLEGLLSWVKNNEGLVSGVMKAVLVLGALVSTVGTLAIAVASLLGPFFLMRFGLGLLGLKGLTLLNVMTKVSGALRAMGPVFTWLGGAMVTGLKFVTPVLNGIATAILWVGRAMLMTPIGLMLTTIAAAALLVYKYWEPISRFATKWGADIMSGLVKGLSSGWSMLRDYVVSVGKNISAWFKDTLGIRSPSRVFIEAGANIAQGAAMGIAGGNGRIRAATVGLATAAITAAPLGANAAPTGPAGGGNYEIHIHALPGMDERALARAVAAELDRREAAGKARSRSSLGDID